MKEKDISKSGTDPQKLPLLLGQKESATLEFKREWYKLNGDGETKKHQRDELIKDILALANGNAYSAGETAILIVGADNQRKENGSRELVDMRDEMPTASSLLELVRAASSPPLENLEVVPFKVYEKQLFAIVIPPSPHLYETTRRLDASQPYSKCLLSVS